MFKKNTTDIFLVEDDKIFLLALKGDIENSFNDRKIKFHTFSSGETCMLKFSQIMPQVVILDYFLNSKYPDAANGLKVLDLIKTEKRDTHVIMLTQEDHIDIAIESFHHGASDYVVKTATKFKKVNYSLTNIFKIIEVRREARRYKFLISALCMCIAFLVGSAIGIQVFAPEFLK